MPSLPTDFQQETIGEAERRTSPEYLERRQDNVGVLQGQVLAVQLHGAWRFRTDRRIPAFSSSSVRGFGGRLGNNARWMFSDVYRTFPVPSPSAFITFAFCFFTFYFFSPAFQFWTMVIGDALASSATPYASVTRLACAGDVRSPGSHPPTRRSPEPCRAG